MPVFAWVCAVSLYSASGASSPTGPANTHLTVEGLGSLQGTSLRTAPTAGGPAQDYVAFKGVPYAKPPVGDLRWRRPQPFGGWSGTRDATSYGPACLPGFSTVTGGNLGNPAPPQASEDCLTLNVLSPAAVLDPHAPKLPVVVYIHGGAYIAGSSTEYPVEFAALYNEGKTIWVSVNYRLSVFGFLGGLALADRSPDRSSGNYGIEDQRLALNWVQRYISYFGGNASLVTIMGHSAGAGSVINHLVQNRSWGLYSRAIILSAWPYAVPLSWAEKQLSTLMSGTGCGTVACLAATEAGRLASLAGPMLFAPVVDGVALTSHPDEMLRQGTFSQVPVLQLFARDETQQDYQQVVEIFPHSALRPSALNMALIIREVLIRSLLVATEGNTMPAFFVGFCEPRLQELVNIVKNLHDSTAMVSSPQLDLWTQMAQQIMREVPMFGLYGGCAMRRRAVWMRAAGQQKLFNGMYAYENGGVANHDDIVSMLSMAPSNQQFAAAHQHLMSYLMAFAASGDPNIANATVWPQLDTNASMLTHAYSESGGVRASSNVMKDVCDFWDQVYLNGTLYSTYGDTGENRCSYQYSVLASHTPGRHVGMFAALLAVLVVTQSATYNF